ncbi:MAG TPA: hypothetical protein VF188_03880 [Longimicrobiales bacterium]
MRRTVARRGPWAALASLTSQTAAQETVDVAAAKAAAWDATEAHGPTRTIEFTAEEGTWMAVDVDMSAACGPPATCSAPFRAEVAAPGTR